MLQHLKPMSRHKTKLKAEKLCRDIEIDSCDIKNYRRNKLCHDTSKLGRNRAGRKVMLSLSQQGFLCCNKHLKG